MTNKPFFPEPETGSFAIILAISLTLILTLFSFALDTGFFLREKNRYQSAAESAALAATDSFCFKDPYQVALEVIQASIPDISEDAVTVETGFFDIHDTYDFPLGIYQDFAPSDSIDYLEDESINAVLVTIGKGETVDSLTGLTTGKEVAAAAVAYVPQIDMVSGGAIDFKSNPNVSLHNGHIFSESWIRLRVGSVASKTKVASESTISTFTGTRPSDSLPEVPLIKKHKISIDELIVRLKKKANNIYSFSNKGREFYRTHEEAHAIYCFFDFTASFDNHEIDFIDLPETLDGKTVNAVLTPYPCNAITGIGIDCDSEKKYSVRSAFGKAMKNKTIAATCNIIVPRIITRDEVGIVLGENDFTQLNIVSSGRIDFFSDKNDLNGVNFLCKGGFKMDFSQSSSSYTPPTKNFFRVINESMNIRFNRVFGSTIKTYNFYLSPTPPLCPPTLPSTLGRLVFAD